VVVFRAAGLGLKPRRGQAEPQREVMKLVRRVGLQVPAPRPAAPVAGHEGVVDVDGHEAQILACRPPAGVLANRIP
jgi:hypothetical protein